MSALEFSMDACMLITPAFKNNCMDACGLIVLLDCFSKNNHRMSKLLSTKHCNILYTDVAVLFLDLDGVVEKTIKKKGGFSCQLLSRTFLEPCTTDISMN